MLVLERRSEHDVRSEKQAELHVERTDISFCDLGADRVRVEVSVQNIGVRRSPPTVMRLESAPLGAFIRWQPLTQLLVPPLEPGESRILRTEARRPRPTPLGDFNRVPPNKLLTAVNSPDQPSPTGAGTLAMLNLLRTGRTGRSANQGHAGGATLAPDLWDLVGRGQTYWAGNINIFVGARAVERHLSRALRVYPGRTNLAMFLVGTPGRRDEFAFELVGLSPDWKAALYDVTNQKSLVADPYDAPIKDEQWVESDSGLVVILATHPPVGCATGKVEVHVTRRASRTPAIVEFDLDPAAQGAGCYCV